MRGLKFPTPKLLRQYPIKLRFTFSVIGIFIVLNLYMSGIITTNIQNSKDGLVRVQDVNKNKIQVQPEQEEISIRQIGQFPDKETNQEHNGRRELQSNGQRELQNNEVNVQLEANKFALLDVNIDLQNAQKNYTFSPENYPCNVNMTRILHQYETKGFVDEPPINRFDYSYIVNPNHICKTPGNIKVLFVVKSGPDHSLRRRTIRETWANTKRFPTIRIVFSFGFPKNSTFLQALLDESTTYNDILVVKDYVDTYYNLTLKTMSGMNWAVTHCARARYVVSVDDDIYVAPDLLLSFLDRPEVRKVDKLFSGHLLINTKPIRNPKDKWMVSLSEYPFQNYPNYNFGGFILMSMSTVKSFTVAALYTRLYKFEDVYLGILAAKIGIEAINNGYVNSRKSFTVSESFKIIIASHSYGDQKDLQRAWDCHLSILDQEDDKSIFCDYIGKRLQKLKSEIDTIVGWMENVKFNS